MKNIEIIDGNKKDKIFDIENYSFVEIESDSSPLSVYRIIIKKTFTDALDVRYWFEEIIGEKTEKIKFFNSNPSELIEYIKNYEIDIPFRETYLFYDIKTKYLD